MKRKRMIKLLMSVGFDRNNAAKAANFCDGSTMSCITSYA